MQINSRFQFQDTLKWELQGLLQAFSQIECFTEMFTLQEVLQVVILRGEW